MSYFDNVTGKDRRRTEKLCAMDERLTSGQHKVALQKDAQKFRDYYFGGRIREVIHADSSQSVIIAIIARTHTVESPLLYLQTMLCTLYDMLELRNEEETQRVHPTEYAEWEDEVEG